MPVNFPLTKITVSQKYGYCYTCQEALQLIHNAMGGKVETNEITLEEFRDWVKTWYDPRWDVVQDVMLELRTSIKLTNKNANPQNVDIDKVVVL